VTYTPEALVLSPGKLFRSMLSDLRAGNGLAWQLARRDVKAQYRGSFLGALWAFITPVVNSAVWIFLSTTGIVRIADTGLPYPAYVFSGTILWQLFAEALVNPIGQVSAAKSMLAKLNFPRESLIIAGFWKLMFSAGIKLLVLVPALLFMGVYPDWRIVLLPLAMLCIVLLGLAIGLLLTPVGMLYGDVARALPLATQLLMYLTPVVFAMPADGLMARLFELNPMTSLLLTARAWATGMEANMLPQAAWVLLGTGLLLLLGWLAYKITMPVIVERMSS
jgi:lipopolysaccharide transport system permease protein